MTFHTNLHDFTQIQHTHSPSGKHKDMGKHMTFFIPEVKVMSKS